MNALALADRLLHALHVPHPAWWRLCDAYDLSLGVPDTPENFPRRHGYVRLTHLYTGTASFPQSATCCYCGKTVAEGGPCLLARRFE